MTSEPSDPRPTVDRLLGGAGGPAAAEPALGTGNGSTPAGPADPPTPDEGGGGSAPGGRRRGHRWLLEWVVILIVVLLCTLVVRTYVFQSYSIPSLSMWPTLKVGDRIIVDKLSYKLHGVHRGDIVVFATPPLEQQDYADLVKRVVGLPGETISSKNGQVYIDGKLLAEPWLPKGPQSWTGPLPGDAHPQYDLPGPVTIPPGDYYVMGDNRTDSEDSRWFGPIPKSLIVGRAVAVVWPLGHVKGL
jgi:signal peptidase I